MKSPRLLLLSAAVSVVAVGFRPGEAKQAAPPCYDLAGGRVEASTVLRSLTQELSASRAQGKTADRKELIGQLSRKRHKLVLRRKPKAKMSPVNIYRQHRRSVVVLGSLYRCPKCTKWHCSAASGFLLTASGVMVTSYHVVDNPTRDAMGAMTHDGKVYLVKEVLAAHKSDDIAVLQLQGSGFAPLALSPGSPVGSPVWVISHPVKRFYTLTAGIISGYFVETVHGAKTDRMAITADFAVGSSGAPVFGERGEVVGMVAATQTLYTPVKNKQKNPQMVVKKCVPAESILALIGPGSRR